MASATQDTILDRLRAGGKQKIPYAYWMLGNAYFSGTEGADQDYGKAITWYRRGAKAGHGPCQRTLAIMLTKGLGTAPDLVEAADLMQSAADQGDSRAALEVGKIFHHGIGVEANQVAAAYYFNLANAPYRDEADLYLAWIHADLGLMPFSNAVMYQKASAAANLGNGFALLALALMHQLGYFGDPDHIEIHAALQDAAETSGIPEAVSRYAIMLQSGKGTAANPRIAFQWFRVGANAGETLCAHELGKCYQNGIGITQNLDLAKKWFFEAAKGGHDDSLPWLASAELKSEGMSTETKESIIQAALRGNFDCQLFIARNLVKNPIISLSQLRKMAQYGCSELAFELGCLLLKSQSMFSDFGEAEFWLTVATNDNNQEALRTLGVHLAGTKKSLEGITLLERAYRRGDQRSAFALGQIYYEGRVGEIPVNKTKAADWFYKAARDGYEDAQWELGKMLLAGDGIPCDETAGEYWIDCAHESAELSLGDENTDGKLVQQRSRTVRPLKAV